MLTVASAVGCYIDSYLDKKSCRDSALSSNAYANELVIKWLYGAFSTSLSYRKACFFMKLCYVLRSKNFICNTRNVKLEEQLTMFLLTIEIMLSTV